MTAPATPAHQLVATTLARVDLDINEQWTVMWALMDRYVDKSKHLGRCREGVRGSVAGIIAPATFAQWVEHAERDLALIESTVAKLPEMLRKVWAEQVAERLAEELA